MVVPSGAAPPFEVCLSPRLKVWSGIIAASLRMTASEGASTSALSSSAKTPRPRADARRSVVAETVGTIISAPITSQASINEGVFIGGYHGRERLSDQYRVAAGFLRSAKRMVDETALLGTLRATFQI